MKVVVFGGTTEGRELSQRLVEMGAEAVVCVASEYGSEQQGELRGVETRIGRLTAQEKDALLVGTALCVDATHPYATSITASVKEACARSGVKYIRLLREKSDVGEEVTEVDSAAEAARFLADTEGNILLTTGAKELEAYAALDPKRLFPRVLPSHKSLEACEAMGIPHQNIIAMQGPFSEELNEAMLRHFSVRYMVTKDGGPQGGFSEKYRAAVKNHVRVVLLRRPTENGENMESILALCRRLLVTWIR